MLAGVTLIETSVALVTVRDAVPTCPANTAEMRVLPAATPVADPWLPMALLMVATDGADDVHATMPVKSNVSPLANMPVAVKPERIVSGTVALAGETCSEDSAAPSTTRPAVALMEPD